MKYDIFSGKYLFHLHTDFTDGELSVEQYFKFARKYKIEKLVFLEHIRQNPDYDVSGLIRNIRDHEKAFDIKAYIGFEAKILSNGFIDISNDHIVQADLIGIAEHSMPYGNLELSDTIANAFINAKRILKTKPVIWVHPGLWYKKQHKNLTDNPEYIRLLYVAQSNGILIERNLKYNLLPDSFSLPSNITVIGIDSHTEEDLKL